MKHITMSTITFQETDIQLEPNESVLDGLLRNNFDIPHGCKAGACQSCLMRVAPTQVAHLPAPAQTGHTATLLEKSLLNDQVLRLRLSTEFEFQAGQYINIWLDQTTTRSYSIASTPAQQYIELHIRLYANGRFSQFAKDHLNAGDTLTIQGPLGQCIYSPEVPDAPLLLAGIGTGLAPLYGILKSALAQNHTGPIHLYLGAKQSQQFYYEQTLLELCKLNPQVHIHFLAQTHPSADAHITEGDIYQAVKAGHSNTANYRIYLCGAESFVRKMKKQCFLSGASMGDIHSDAFLPSA